MGFTIQMEENKILLQEEGETLCWLSETVSDKCAAVSLGGKLRADTAYVFLDEVNALCSVGLSITLDLREVTYLSNAYLQAMQVIQRTVDAKKQTLTLQNLSPQARAAVDAVGAGFLFNIQ